MDGREMEPDEHRCPPNLAHPEPADDFAVDALLAMANHEEDDTGVPGSIFVFTTLGRRGRG